MSSSELKTKAKELLEGKKMNAAIMILVYGIVSAVVSMILGTIFPGQTYTNEYGIEITQQNSIASIINSAVTIFLSLGMSSYYLKIARGETPELTEIFSKGSLFPKAFVTGLLTGLLICLGTVALIIPGIILIFCYSMINYIYLDNPEIGIVEVMKKSREIMKGHKWEYFCLMLSFIGWVLLAPFTLCILFFWLIPYIGVTGALFYDSIKE